MITNSTVQSPKTCLEWIRHDKMSRSWMCDHSVLCIRQPAFLNPQTEPPSPHRHRFVCASILCFIFVVHTEVQSLVWRTPLTAAGYLAVLPMALSAPMMVRRVIIQ